MVSTLHPKDEKRALWRVPRFFGRDRRRPEFKHIKAGIWDVYEQVPAGKFGINVLGASKLFRHPGFNLRFVWRMAKNVAMINSFCYYSYSSKLLGLRWRFGV